MSIIFLLILVSLVVALIFLVAFFWAVKDGQYEDDVSPSVRILYEDDQPLKGNSTEPAHTKHQPQPIENGT